jgi:hypothetical protein
VISGAAPRRLQNDRRRRIASRQIRLDRFKLYGELASTATTRSAAASRLGGTPNIRRYSRLNCDGLS